MLTEFCQLLIQFNENEFVHSVLNRAPERCRILNSCKTKLCIVTMSYEVPEGLEFISSQPLRILPPFHFLFHNIARAALSTLPLPLTPQLITLEHVKGS